MARSLSRRIFLTEITAVFPGHMATLGQIELRLPRLSYQIEEMCINANQLVSRPDKLLIKLYWEPYLIDADKKAEKLEKSLLEHRIALRNLGLEYDLTFRRAETQRLVVALYIRKPVDSRPLKRVQFLFEVCHVLGIDPPVGIELEHHFQVLLKLPVMQRRQWFKEGDALLLLAKEGEK